MLISTLTPNPWRLLVICLLLEFGHPTLVARNANAQEILTTSAKDMGISPAHSGSWCERRGRFVVRIDEETPRDFDFTRLRNLIAAFGRAIEIDCPGMELAEFELGSRHGSRYLGHAQGPRWGIAFTDLSAPTEEPEVSYAEANQGVYISAFDDFAFPDLISALYNGNSRSFAAQPIVPLAYIAGVNEALNDQSVLYLVDNPRGLIREVDPGMNTAIGRKIVSNPQAVQQSTQQGMQALGAWLGAVADARKRGASIQEEVAAGNQALLGGGGHAGLPAASAEQAKSYGQRDGRILALLYDEDLDTFRGIYQGMQRFVYQELR